jgi:hypothetical protein
MPILVGDPWCAFLVHRCMTSLKSVHIKSVRGCGRNQLRCALPLLFGCLLGVFTYLSAFHHQEKNKIGKHNGM